jgi:gliding motility-associated-like protein
MATLDLTSAAGTTVAIDFASGDCALKGHFGYGYVDMNCGLFQVYATQCNGAPNITLTAPTGYEHYKWMDASLTTLIDTHRVAILPTPLLPTTYALILTPYVGYGCPDTLYTTYVIATTSVQISPDTTICAGGRTTLNALATSNDPPITYLWSPTRYLSCFNCASPIARPPKTMSYMVIATSHAGCADSATIKITTDSSLSFLAQIKANRDTVCPYEQVKVKNTFLGKSITTTYPWITDGATILVKALDSMTLYWSTPGLKRVMVDITNYDCFVTDTVFIFVRSPEAITAPKDIYICPHDTAHLTVSTTSTIPLVYMWYPNQFVTCTKCQYPKSYTPKNQQYFVTYINEGLCPDTQFVMVHLDTVDAQITLPSDTICCNQQVIIKNNITQSSKHVQYSWNLDGGIILKNDSLGTITAKWTEPGMKNIKLQIGGSNCDGKDSVKMYVMPPYTADFKMPDKACQNQSVTITPVKQYAYYHWLIDEQEIHDSTYQELNLVWTKLGMKKVFLLVTNKFMCDSQSHADSIPVYETPNTYLQSSIPKICEGDYVELTTTSDPNYTYTWKPEGAFDNISGNSAAITIKQTGTISVTATNQFDCSNTASIYVNTALCCKVMMPDAFTPNGDGRNDFYHPVGIDKQKVELFMIANRWGQILYTSSTPTGGWDGTINGEKQDPGTYSYYLKYTCSGSAFEEKGNFILLR